MKKLTLLILIVLLVPIALAQTAPAPPPTDTSTAVMQKIDQEHKNTRKFVSDELTRQREEWVRQIDDRANYYEITANNLIQSATWKFGLVWAGVTFFILALNSLLRTRIERKKYDKLKKSLVGETTEQMMGQLKQQQEQLDLNYKKMQAESQATMQTHFQKLQRMVAETKRNQPIQPPPPLMDYDGRPMGKPTVNPSSGQPTPKVTFEQLSQLMQDYGLRPQASPVEQSFEMPPLPTPPPYVVAPAPRKLGFFERRRMNKLEKQLKELDQRKQRRDQEQEKVMGQILQIDPTYSSGVR